MGRKLPKKVKNCKLCARFDYEKRRKKKTKLVLLRIGKE